MKALNLLAVDARARRRPQLGPRGDRQVRPGRRVFGLEFGETNAVSRIVYGLVGLAAVYAIGVLVAARPLRWIPARRPPARRPRRKDSEADDSHHRALVAVVALAVASAGRRGRPGPADIVETAAASGQFKTWPSCCQAPAWSRRSSSRARTPSSRRPTRLSRRCRRRRSTRCSRTRRS